VNHPLMVRSTGNVVLGWIAETRGGAEARAVLDALSGSNVVVVLDPSFAGSAPATSILLPGGSHLWMTRHTPENGSRAQLRFVQLSAHGASLVGLL
jgi:hypothetical protein